jgi:hypothetical protein
MYQKYNRVNLTKGKMKFIRVSEEFELSPFSTSLLGEFIRANSKKIGSDPTFSWRFFSLTNHIANICFSHRANKFA